MVVSSAYSGTTDIAANLRTPSFSNNVDVTFFNGTVDEFLADANSSYATFGNCPTPNPIFTPSPVLHETLSDILSTTVIQRPIGNFEVNSQRIRNPPISPFEPSRSSKESVGLTSRGRTSRPEHFILGGATGAFGEEFDEYEDTWLHEQVVAVCNNSNRECSPSHGSDARGRDCVYHPNICRLLKARTLILDLFGKREMTFRQLAKIFAKELLYSLLLVESADVLKLEVILWNSAIQTTSDTAHFEQQIMNGCWTLSLKLLHPSVSDERKTLQISRDFSAENLRPIMDAIRNWVECNGGIPVGEIGYHVIVRKGVPEQVTLTPWMARYHQWGLCCVDEVDL